MEIFYNKRKIFAMEGESIRGANIKIEGQNIE